MVILGLCFILIDWLSFGERRGRFKLDVKGQGDGRILNVVGQEGWGILKIGQFSWASCVYHP